MKSTRKRVLIAVSALGLLLAGTRDAAAQWTVHDPINYVSAVLRYYQLVQQYKLMFEQTKRIAGLARYRRPHLPMLSFKVTNDSEKTARLAYALNNHLTAEEIDSIFRETFTQMDKINRGLVQTDDPLRFVYGLNEFLDGTTKENVRTLGRLRSLQREIETAIQNLDGDIISGGDLQSQTAIMQKTSAASLVIARELQATNQVLVGLMEQQMFLGRMYRDGQADAINAELYRRTQFDDVMRPLKNVTLPEVKY